MADKRLRLIVEAVTSGAQQALRGLSGTIKQFGTDAERSLQKPTEAAKGMGAELATLSAAAGLFLADMAMRYGRMATSAVYSTAQAAASNLALETSFEAVAEQYGLGSDKIIEALRGASKGTISNFELMAAASTAMRLGVASDIGEFEDLMKIAYVRARETGKTVADAWNWMAIGIGRGSPRILDNLNILIKEEQVMEDWAQTIGKTADELSLLERQEATRNAVLQQGAQDLQNWNDAAYDSVDVFERQRVATADLKQAIGEELLPYVLNLTEALLDLQRASKGYTEDANAVVTAVLDEGGTVDEAAAKLEEYNRAHLRGRQGLVSWQEVLQGVTIAEHNMSIVQGAVAERWGQMYQESAKARLGLKAVDDVTEDTTQALEDQQKALEKSQDIWGNYLRDVSEENWRYAQRYEDMQFSMRQSAERALFDLMKTERDAADRRGDLLESADIRIEADSARHSTKMRDIAQDLADDLLDMEWDLQRDRSEAMKKAPWWIRQALGKEYQERERIAGTGDEKALKDYDAMLLERIRAIDPVYAQELELLQDQYDHKEDIDRREADQSLQREKDSWRVTNREQERGLDQQLRELNRNLGYQLEEWQFHQRQREESEGWSMQNLIVEHEHSLGKMYDDTQRKLGDLVPVYEHYGYESWIAWLRGFNNAQSQYGSSPATGGNPFENWVNPWASAQGGMEYVPRTMPVMVHKGESILPAPAAQQMREGLGGATIMIQKLIVGSGRAGAQEFLNAVNQELGSSVARRSR